MARSEKHVNMAMSELIFASPIYEMAFDEYWVARCKSRYKAAKKMRLQFPPIWRADTRTKKVNPRDFLSSFVFALFLITFDI